MRKKKLMIVHPCRVRPLAVSCNAERSKERGFTLIETAVAMVVMMVVGLSIASLFVYAINNNSGANDRELALGIAQQRMERLRNVTFNVANSTISVANGGLGATDATGFVEPDVTMAGRHYRVVTIINDLAFDASAVPVATIKRITIQVSPQGGGTRLGSVTLTSLRTTTILGTN